MTPAPPSYTVTEAVIPREMLVADECFFVGTAAEVTPVRSIDKLTIGAGRRGPVPRRCGKRSFDAINAYDRTAGSLTCIDERASPERKN